MTPKLARAHRRLRTAFGSSRSPTLTLVTVTSTALLLGALVAPSRASREVLGGIDCVVEPSAVVDLGAAVSGRLAETRHDRGDAVTAGTLMARLESGVETAALAIAEQIAASDTAVSLRAASSGLGARVRARTERLHESDAVSEQRLDEARTEARVAALQLLRERESHALAQLEVARARAALERRELRSPIDGVVVERYLDAGEHVDSEAVYRIARLDPLHVEVIVPIEFLGALSAGMPATVRLAVPGFETRPLEASVARVDAVADAASASYGVRLVLANPDLALPSGVRCQVDFLAS